MKTAYRFALAAALAAGMAACSLNGAGQDSEPGVANPDIWPQYEYPVPRDPAVEAKIADLISRMTLEEKIGQLVQADLCCVTPADVKQYNLGSILVGGDFGHRVVVLRPDRRIGDARSGYGLLRRRGWRHLGLRQGRVRGAGGERQGGYDGIANVHDLSSGGAPAASSRLW